MRGGADWKSVICRSFALFLYDPIVRGHRAADFSHDGPGRLVAVCSEAEGRDVRQNRLARRGSEGTPGVFSLASGIKRVPSPPPETAPPHRERARTRENSPPRWVAARPVVAEAALTATCAAKR